MAMRFVPALALAAILGICSLASLPAASADQPDIVINEVLASQTGVDNTEFIELYGPPGTSLQGLSLIIVEGDAEAATGNIDRRLDFRSYHHIGANGYFLIGVCEGLAEHYGVTPDKPVAANFIENSSLTIALVKTTSLGGNTVNGNETAWDAVGLSDGGSGDTFYFNAPELRGLGRAVPPGVMRQAGVWSVHSSPSSDGYTPTAGGLAGCQPLPATIPEIQGHEARSPYEGETVTTTGIVTRFNSNNRDFWLQDAAGDGDPSTSDGILVYKGGEWPVPPQIGDQVRVTARVEERASGAALPVTRMASIEDIAVLASGAALPAPVEVTTLPHESIDDAIAFWEPLEGMLVSIKAATVVGPSSRFGEFAVVTAADVVPGSGFETSGHMLLRDPGDTQLDYNPERIVVADASVRLRPGDTIDDLTAVVDYSFGNYKLRPIRLAPHARELPRPPVSTHSKAQGDTVITTLNMENLFDSEDDPDKADETSTLMGEALETKLNKLALAIAGELRYPDIVVAEEVENKAILQRLGDRVNAAGETDYVATSLGSSDRRGIEVGFLWDRRRVKLMDAMQLNSPAVAAAFGPDSPSPGREPLVGVFDVAGTRVTVVGNHFKSKGEDDPLYGVHQPAQRASEIQRKAQARAVREYVNTVFDADPDALLLIAGDLNDFPFGEPGEGGDHPLAILHGGPDEVPLTNLVQRLGAAGRYTYLHDGNSQVLDHILVSPRLAERVAAVDALHFNADYPESLGQDSTTALRASDHDPLEARFKLRGEAAQKGQQQSASKASLGPLLIAVFLVLAWGYRRYRRSV